MKIGLICLSILCIALILGYQTLLNDYNTVACGNFPAACINVIRQTEAKQLTVFATVPTTPRKEHVQDYTIDVIADGKIIKNNKPFGGAYHQHHNGIILNFAAVQILDGDRKLGLRLIQILAEVDPEYIWSSPNLPNRTIQEIRKGVETDDSSISAVLKDEKQQWAWRVKEYGNPVVNSSELLQRK